MTSEGDYASLGQSSESCRAVLEAVFEADCFGYADGFLVSFFRFFDILVHLGEFTWGHVSEGKWKTRCLTYQGCAEPQHSRHHTRRPERVVGSEQQGSKLFGPIG